ncbi:MAG: hypothetical protein A2074_05855 [Candidatus Aquicultor primus]|uniref:NADH:ubiquinone oxidoreductase 30kDa subunit domain-containing protein n=1 Tax=Candidatus Aquicultor primus TaxID=1797195 RepID=A0A1F2UJH5_9ACTN|nr:MAG: hypothetical protein A2074_05855 [Candidatus Aquicultor primus]HCH00155.1 hypothetical protein [Actinomycetota bacterium]
MNEEFNLEKQEKEMPEQGKIVLEDGLGYALSVERKDLLKAASGLKEAGFDLFQFVAGVDYPDSIKLTYRVFSSKRKNQIAVFLKTEVPKDDPTVDSLVSIWPAADWHERETFDLLGVDFVGHPNMSRIFMPGDWVGYPLRKDYADDRIIVMDDGKKEKPAAKVEKAEAVETAPEKVPEAHQEQVQEAEDAKTDS